MDQVSYSTSASGGGQPLSPGEAIKSFEQTTQETHQMETEGGHAPAIPVARPEWLPDKFNSPEDMARAYSELETRMGQQGVQPQPDPQQAGQEIPQGSELGTYLEQAANEYDRTGQLSYATQQALEQRGIPAALQQTYITGLNAQAAQEMNTIHQAVGGQETWNQMVQWAQANLQPAEIDTFNNMLGSGTDQAVMAARGLLAQMQGVGPAPEPQLLKGNPNPIASRTEPLSEHEMMELMGSRAYKAGDPATHAKVDAGLIARIQARNGQRR